MLTDVLNAPVAELTVGHDIDVGQDLLDTRTLQILVSHANVENGPEYALTLSSSRQFSKMF